MPKKLEALPDDGNAVVGEVKLVPRHKIRPFPDQPRKFFDKQKLRELADSIQEVGQIVAVLVRKLVKPDPDYDWELIDGQRRWHACAMAGVKLMKVHVVPVRDTAEQYLISVVANFGRADHTPLEAANAIKFFRDQGMTYEQIAKIFARSVQWVGQYLKLLKLDASVQALMAPELPEDQQLGLSAALLLADVPADLQKPIADTIVGKRMKVDQARNFVRQRAEKMGFKVGDPKRRPSDDYRVLRTFVWRLRRELEMLVEMPQSFFDTMLKFRDFDDCDVLIRRVESNVEQLHVVLGALNRARAKQEAALTTPKQF